MKMYLINGITYALEYEDGDYIVTVSDDKETIGEFSFTDREDALAYILSFCDVDFLMKGVLAAIRQ